MTTREGKKQLMRVSALVPFLVISFGLTWGIALLMILFPEQLTAIFGEISQTNPLYILAVYAPGFAGVSLIFRYYGLRGLGSFLRRFMLLRASLSWWLFILLGIPAVYYFGAVITGSFSNPFPFDPWYSVFPALLFMLVLGPVEEFGWRGIALPLLQRRLVPLWSAVLLGAVWGIWHLPSFFIGGTPHSDWMFVAFFVGVVSLSVIMTALFNSSRGSLIIAVLFHFQINNPIWPDGKPWDFVLFSVVAVIIVILNREKMLTHKNSVTGVLMPGEDPGEQ
ncbi:CPBP family intramembrane glutamic endopeptidase [Dethiobacter alkaliphilus]|uniref:CPBP family intramembrane glutamic endopeptidase n=1 Tax=Dethiobacter alkaliphilus TaxID=427926 RepID=UPI0022260DAF|nr:type II CAAX endopeptidase family protein [Dethiobacter alkaliphilus]MCW3488584.1 CPBP family intramembrane metalloprotease [Dethiobacter alkaliphilus]